jgi:hypothetical protein
MKKTVFFCPLYSAPERRIRGVLLRGEEGFVLFEDGKLRWVQERRFAQRFPTRQKAREFAGQHNLLFPSQQKRRK